MPVKFFRQWCNWADLRGRICACRRKTQSLSIDVQLILVCKDLSISNSEVNALAGLPGMSRNVETI